MAVSFQPLQPILSQTPNGGSGAASDEVEVLATPAIPPAANQDRKSRLIHPTCQDQNRVTADDPTSGGEAATVCGSIEVQENRSRAKHSGLIFEPFTFANSLPWRTPVMGAS